MSVGILYERSEIDEIGVRFTAEELGIPLSYIPFRKIAVVLYKGGYSLRSRGKDYSENLEDVSAVLNRAQSKNRRLMATDLLEILGKYVINPSIVERICYSKLRTTLHLWKEGIKTPETIYVPCDPLDRTENGQVISNHEEIADLIQMELKDEDVVVKPDAGTHGKNIRLAHGRTALMTILEDTSPSMLNPVGVVVQKYIRKWFYDLRIIVTRQKGTQPLCHPIGMARAGFNDFRTNASLGNMVFGVELPERIRNAAIKCGNAIAKESHTWVIALDAMVDFKEDMTGRDEDVKCALEKLKQSFDSLNAMKKDYSWCKDFAGWNDRLEKNFQDYKGQDAYWRVKEIIEDSIVRNHDRIVFHEANACPEFWERTRLATGLNVAIPLLKGAQSIGDGSFAA